MTDHPSAQPPHQPSGPPAQGHQPTQPMPGAAGASGAPPPGAPATNVWRQATSTNGGRWAIGIAAGALALLMVLGIAVAGLLVLRTHDRFSMMGQRLGGMSRGQGGQGGDPGDIGPGARGYAPLQPGMPGAPGGRGYGPDGLGGVLGGTALHGTVTATVNGSVQALVFQRGEVTAVSATSITLKSADGVVGTFGRSSVTTPMGSAPLKGGQAYVLARAADKVAVTVVALPTTP